MQASGQSSALSCFFLFPHKDAEQRLLSEYHQADSRQLRASRAAASPAD